VQDICIRFNTFDNIAQGLNMSGHDAPNISQRTSRILIQNNVWHVTNLGSGGDGRLFQVLSGPTDVIFDHNTGFTVVAYMVSDGTPNTDYFVFQNNIVNYGVYGFIGTGTGNANTTLAAYFNPNWVVTKNAVIGGSSTNYPPGSYFPANNAAVGFVNYAGGDYHLTAASPYHNLGTDGKDLGADIDSIAIASTYDCNASTSVAEAGMEQSDCILFPVPADAYLHVQTDILRGESAYLSLYDAFGSIVLMANTRSNAEVINTSSMPTGMYLLKVQSKEKVTVRKFIVQH
jgi:hypothetical protein